MLPARQTSMYEDPPEDVAEEEEEEEQPVVKPPPKRTKLMADAIPKSPPPAHKAKSDPKGKSKAAVKKKKKKKKAAVTEEEEGEEAPAHLRKLRPFLPEHNEAHPEAEDMKQRKDRGLRRWRAADPYAIRRRTTVDYRFHTKEQQDFYETVLLDKSPAVSEMRWVDWKFIDRHENNFPNVHENFKTLNLDKFLCEVRSDWNDELIMQFYSTVHFYPDGKIRWMTEGQRLESSVDEWAKLLGLPPRREGFLDVYAKSKMDHNSMANMYKPIPAEDVERHKLGSVYHLLPGLATINTILRYTLMPKSGDDRMIRGYSIDMLHHIDEMVSFNVMDLIVETIKRTAADQKRSCGYAPYIQLLINSKVGSNIYQLERKHLPLQPELEDCTVTMDASHPSSAAAQEQAEAARAAATQTRGASTSTAQLPKTKSDQMTYLLLATQRIEQGLANLVKNQESLERIMETKFHSLDVKVTEMATDVEKLKADFEARYHSDSDEPPTTTQFQAQPRPATVVDIYSSTCFSCCIYCCSTSSDDTSSLADFSRGICRCSDLHSFDPHRCCQPEVFFTCSCGSSPERRLALDHSNFLVTCCQRGRVI